MARCEDLSSRLAGAALDALDDGVSEEVRQHVSGCSRCAAQLRSLQKARALLDAVQVPAAGSVSGAAIRAAAAIDVTAPPSFSVVRSIRAARVAAAAALLISIAALWLALGTRRPQTHAPAHPSSDPGIPTQVIADAVVELETRLAALERRHERDLVVLARAVDDERMEAERGLSARFAALRTVTRDEIARTRLALDGVAALVLPAASSPEER
jgi:hypothetical protein